MKVRMCEDISPQGQIKNIPLEHIQGATILSSSDYSSLDKEDQRCKLCSGVKVDKYKTQYPYWVYRSTVWRSTFTTAHISWEGDWEKKPGGPNEETGDTAGFTPRMCLGGIDTYTDGEAGIRPVLKLSNIEDVGLNVGDSFKINGFTFKIFDKNKAVCDCIVGFCYYSYETDPYDAERVEYKNSETKKRVERWFKSFYTLAKQREQEKFGDTPPEKTKYAQLLDHIKGITLLSKSDAEHLTPGDAGKDKKFWLRTCMEPYLPYACKTEGYDIRFVASDSEYASQTFVRPALEIENIQDTGYKKGDYFEFGGHPFKIIKDNLAFSMDYLPGGEMAFNGRDFKCSKIKKYIDEWFFNVIGRESKSTLIDP